MIFKSISSSGFPENTFDKTAFWFRNKFYFWLIIYFLKNSTDFFIASEKKDISFFSGRINLSLFACSLYSLRYLNTVFSTQLIVSSSSHEA